MSWGTEAVREVNKCHVYQWVPTATWLQQSLSCWMLLWIPTLFILLLESLLFCLHTHMLSIYYIEQSMKRRNLEYFPLQCDGVQFTQLLDYLFFLWNCSVPTSEQYVSKNLSRDEWTEHFEIVAFKPRGMGYYERHVCAEFEVYLHFSSFLLVLFYRKGIISCYSAFSFFRVFHTDEILLSLCLNICF